MRFQRKSVLWFFGIGVLLAAALLLIANVVEAQEVVVPAVADDAQGWIAFAQQLLLLIVTGVLIPLGLKFLQDRGLAVEQKHRDALQAAAMNAAGLLLDSSLSWEQKKQRALGYVETGARDALDYFKADPERVFMIVLSYYSRMTQGHELPENMMEVDDIIQASRRRSQAPSGVLGSSPRRWR